MILGSMMEIPKSYPAAKMLKAITVPAHGVPMEREGGRENKRCRGGENEK